MASSSSPAGPWPTSVAELSFEKLLGRGFFGEVWRCLQVARTANPVKLAVKKVPLALVRQHNLTAQLEKEVAIMRSLSHPHIVNLLFDFRDEDHVYLGMELAEGGGMFDKLSRVGKFSLDLCAQYFYETCDALEYLHGLPEKVIHRDIKPENILLDRDGHVKLADFGWASIMENVASRATFCGTPDYLAPEMIRGEGHNESLDMWEMGVLLYEMVVGKSPFGSGTQEKTCRLILKCDLRFPDSIDADARDCIKNLCKLRPDDRLTASQAKKHLFVVRHHRGRPTEVVGAAEIQEERPSVGSRRLARDKEILEEEMQRVLLAKSHTEQDLLQMTIEFEEVHNELRKETRMREAAEKELSKMKEGEARHLRELEELKQVTKTLLTEVGKFKRAGA